MSTIPRNPRKGTVMPTFDTPGPIDVRLSLIVGDVQIVAADVSRTTVDVRPRSGSPEDVLAAEQTGVAFSGNHLEIRTRKPKRGFLEKFTADTHDGAITVTVEVPAGSSVQGEAGMGKLHSRGRLGECRFKTAAGDIELEETGALRLDTALGLVSVGRAAGPVDAVTAHGQVRFGQIDGPAVIKNLSGPIEIAGVTGDLKLTGVNGDITVDQALSDVAVKTANGNMRIGEVRRGSVSLETAAGSIEVGVREGTAAHLDARSLVGSVHNSLSDTDGPGSPVSTVKVHARTHFGAIEVRRALLGEYR